MMKMKGYGWSNGAASIINAVATWKGSAFAIELVTRAVVELDHSSGIKGEVPGVDTRLIERCVVRVLDHLGLEYGGRVITSSEIPIASGLKSSSAAANAVILATLDALDVDMDLVSAAKIGVEAAREVGVTITGALDDALASMLGGVVVTDNREMSLLRRDELNCSVMLLVPDQRIFSRDTDISRSRIIAPMADLAFDLAMQADYGRAMTLNGLAYCAALGLSSEPLILALEKGARGASLSGTGPSYAALIDESKMDGLEESWRRLGGRVIRTKANNRCASRGQGF